MKECKLSSGIEMLMADEDFYNAWGFLYRLIFHFMSKNASYRGIRHVDLALCSCLGGIACSVSCAPFWWPAHLHFAAHPAFRNSPRRRQDTKIRRKEEALMAATTFRVPFSWVCRKKKDRKQENKKLRAFPSRIKKSLNLNLDWY